MAKPIMTMLLCGMCLCATAQDKISWKALSFVKFEEKFNEEVGAQFYYPTFGPSVKALDGKQVFIKGFVLVLDKKNGLYILSKNPYAACFFCGNDGPETIIELRLKPGYPTLKMDQVAAFQGRLRLNEDNIDECNYILEEAEVFGGPLGR